MGQIKTSRCLVWVGLEGAGVDHQQKHYCEIDVDDVPFLQRTVVGYPVDHDVVDRGADRLGETPVVERGWVDVVFQASQVDHFINEICCHTGLSIRQKATQKGMT